jgi:transcriptional regulator with XRE-family HTH domain
VVGHSRATGRSSSRLDGALPLMLRAERLRAYLTQEQLATRSGMSMETIRKYEGGSRAPGRDRLLRLLDAMRVPQPRAGILLATCGYAPRQVSGDAPGTVKGFSLELAARSIERIPWPRLIADDTFGVAAANSAARRLFGLSSERDRTTHARALNNLLTVLADPVVSGRIANLDACLVAVTSAVKAALERALPADDAESFADDILEACAHRDPSFGRRALHAWESAPAARSAFGEGFAVAWHGPDGATARFVAASSPIAGVAGYQHIDVHPADSVSHALLERLAEDQRMRHDHTTNRQMRQSPQT